MQQIQLSDQLYQEAQRRAAEAGFASVDEYVADRLHFDFAEDQDNFDDRFTPEIIAHLDRISEEMKAGKSVSIEEAEEHLAKVRDEWLKSRQG
jgi:hypothetical protein